MRNSLWTTLAVAGLAGSACWAQAPKSAPSKSKTAPAKPASPGIKGTQQLAGDEGKMGAPYTLTSDGMSVNVALDSAELRVSRVNIDDVMIAPAATEKLLVLNFTVQNPNKQEIELNSTVLKFTVVDAQDVNHENEDIIARVGTQKRLLVQLKPAQKVSAYTVIRIPAKGPVPKLIVQSGQSRVVRYDLRGKVKPLEAPIADPGEPGGVTAREEVPAQPGTAYPVQRWDVRFVSAAYAAGPIGEAEPEEGKRFLVATLEITNQGPEAAEAASSLAGRAELAGGERLEFQDPLLRATGTDAVSGEVKPGGKITVRYLCQVPRDAAVKRLLFSEAGGEGRWYAFDAAGIK